MTSEASFEEIIYDIESDGLLPELVDPPYGMTTIHCMVILDIPTEEIISFVRDDLLPLSDEDVAELAEAGITEVFPLTKGVNILENAKLRAGHKINTFDEKAIALVYPDYNPKGALRDTLVMVRMTHADIKEKDFRTVARGKLEGKFLGKQGLEAWGQRLGMHKGDYKKDREESLKHIHKEQGKPDPTQAELHNYVWGTWNPAMHIYMVQDARVNLEVYNMVEKFNWSNEAIQLEHGIDALMGQQEQNGFAVDVEHFDRLAAHLREEYIDYSSKAVEHIGKWFRPKKLSKKDIYNPAFGENRERRVWGLVTEPKRSAKMSKSLDECKKSGDFTKLRASTVQGAAFVATEVKEFNPNSRPQIIDRLQTLYGWEPQDFTEKGSPIVDDDVLRNLSKEIPLAETLAEIFFLKKRLGQIADGKNGWLKLVRKDGRIHGSVNVGGTVSGRATHANPNASQVPGVNAIEVKDHDKGAALVEDFRNRSFLGRPALVKAKWNPNKGEWSIVTRGREGGYGWDCREGFVTTPGYKLVGCDLSGVEFRCLSNLTFPYDDGEMVDIVLNGDIHQRNADLGGISRSIAKRALYAALYGGGDSKLGYIIAPLASEARQKILGADLRKKLMQAMPSLAKAIKEIKREKRQNSNTIRGLDGRRLYVRSDHSALNLRLQSDGALIAKKWNLLIDDEFYARGWDHHVEGEYHFVNWSHDETEVCVREGLEHEAAKIMEDMAPLAGEYFNFKCPIAAEAKIGVTWAEVH